MDWPPGRRDPSYVFHQVQVCGFEEAVKGPTPLRRSASRPAPQTAGSWEETSRETPDTLLLKLHEPSPPVVAQIPCSRRWHFTLSFGSAHRQSNSGMDGWKPPGNKIYVKAAERKKPYDRLRNNRRHPSDGFLTSVANRTSSPHRRQHDSSARGDKARGFRERMEMRSSGGRPRSDTTSLIRRTHAHAGCRMIRTGRSRRCCVGSGRSGIEAQSRAVAVSRLRQREIRAVVTV